MYRLAIKESPGRKFRKLQKKDEDLLRLILPEFKKHIQPVVKSLKR